MSEVALKSDPNDLFASAKDIASWCQSAEKLTEDEGYFYALGAKHWALFCDLGPTLLVSFEQIQAVRERPNQMPLANDIARANGWSHLCILSDGDTWFRDPAVYSYFDQLVDDAFLEDFDQVLFYGVGSSGYAACAYSVTAPGARVLAINPKASLASDVASWDKRYTKQRRLDFTQRYGFAPRMVEGAESVTLIFDPTIPEDAMHAQLFHGPNIHKFRAPHAKDLIATVLEQTKQLPVLISLAMAGTLGSKDLAKAWRTRRNNGLYLRTLLAKAEQSGRPALELLICRNVTARLKAPRFVKRLAQLTQEADK
jgi:hypothetical protein